MIKCQNYSRIVLATNSRCIFPFFLLRSCIINENTVADQCFLWKPHNQLITHCLTEKKRQRGRNFWKRMNRMVRSVYQQSGDKVEKSFPISSITFPTEMPFRQFTFSFAVWHSPLSHYGCQVRVKTMLKIIQNRRNFSTSFSICNIERKSRWRGKRERRRRKAVELSHHRRAAEGYAHNIWAWLSPAG